MRSVPMLLGDFTLELLVLYAKVPHTRIHMYIYIILIEITLVGECSVLGNGNKLHHHMNG